MSSHARLLLAVGGLLSLFASGLVATSSPATAAVTGSFKVDCTFVKAADDDPIVLPNQPGASHKHDFFGNTGISAYSTLASLDGVTSTCANKDFSSYWLPSLYRDGKKIKPTGFIAYYENRFAAGEKVETFPPGFRMIFGNKNAATEKQLDDHIRWACSDNSQFGVKTPPASCATQAIQLRLMWPYCWDGKTPASGSYRMSFAPGGKCPAATPHRLPTLRTNIMYDVRGTTGEYTLSSGSVYSVHADFFNAWDPKTLDGLVERCLNGGVSCGHFRGTSPGRTPPPVGPAADPTPTAADPAGSPTAGAPTTAAAVSPAASPSATADRAPAVVPVTAGSAGAGIGRNPARSAGERPGQASGPVHLVSGERVGPQLWLGASVLVLLSFTTGWLLVRRTRRRTGTPIPPRA